MPVPHNENLSEAIGTPFVLVPASVAAGTATVGPVNAGNATRVMFELFTGAISGGSTVNAKVQAAATSGGSYTDVAGAAITAITTGTGGLKQVEVKGDSLAAAGQGPWLKLLITVGTAACVLGGRALVGTPHYAPSSALDAATVTEKVVV